jgi:uncharacterized protein (TIGR04255 family)
MSYGPDIPDVGHEVFKNPPLKAMLGQVRFPPVLRITDLPSLIPFQEAIRHEFPTFRPEQQISLIMGPQGPQSAAAQQAFRFSTADEAWSAVLSLDAVTVEANPAARYTSYDEFVARFRIVWDAVLKHFDPTQVLRQGLRYVDHIAKPSSADDDWSTLINAELLGPLGGAFGGGVAQSVSELRFRRADGALVFKHGMLPLGPGGELGYLLDFDYFTEVPTDDASTEALLARFDSYHKAVYAFFRWCVTEGALSEFRRDE